MTSKLQVTVPKVVADAFGIRPGDEIEWIPAGDTLRVVPAKKKRAQVDTRTRLRWFDAATARQRTRQAECEHETTRSRGWTREELYTRGGSG